MDTGNSNRAVSMNSRTFSVLSLSLLLLIFSQSTYSVTAEESQQGKRPDENTLFELENSFHRVTSAVLTSLPVKNLPHVSNSKELEEKYNNLVTAGKSLQAIALVHQNQNLVSENIEQASSLFLLQEMLKHNDFLSATKIQESARQFSDRITNSLISYAFAQYWFERYQWNKVVSLLNNVDSDLKAHEASHALLMRGYALQKLKKHRQAIKEYSKIPKTSTFYYPAALNIATAYLRQDWWTDAHTLLFDAAGELRKKGNDELANRVNLFLGYMFLHKEYYRDAREEFRKISIDSQYVNSALMGITIAATSQQDYVGALNSASALAKKQEIDLYVDESRIMLPYIYERLKQLKTASAAYTDASTYYSSRIDSLRKLINNHDFYSNYLQGRSESYMHNIFEQTDPYISILMANLRRLDEFTQAGNEMFSESLKKQIVMTIGQHQSYLQQHANRIVDRRIGNLESYRNQSQYGIARLFDNSNSYAN